MYILEINVVALWSGDSPSHGVTAGLCDGSHHRRMPNQDGAAITDLGVKQVIQLLSRLLFATIYTSYPLTY